MKKRLLLLRNKTNKLSLLGAAFLFLMLMQVSAIYAQNAIRAQHGNGKYKDQIYWLKWGNKGDIIQNGKTITFSTTSGLQYTVTVSNVTTDNSTYPPRADIYNSWKSNNFQVAYNFGSGSGQGFHYGYKDEVISIATQKGTTVSFDLNISAVVTGTSIPVQDFAFVIAGSETLANNTEYYSIEALAPVSGETVIQPIETYVYSSDFQLNVQSFNGGKKLLATNPAPDNVTEDGRGDVIFAATHVQNIKVTIKGKTGSTGKGSQAIALGLIDLLDWGDAPNTYEQPMDGSNNARHYSLPSLGGTPWPDGTTNWTSQPSAEGLVSLEEPLLGLGNYLDVEDVKQTSEDATGDDMHFVEGSTTNDEDAIPGLKWFKDCDGAVKVHNAHKTKTGYLYVWIDADGDAKFSADEKYGSSIPIEPNFDGVKFIDFRNGFSVPNFQPTEGLERILRFRVSYDNSLDVSGLSTSGEIEDHLIKFVVPKVTPLTTHINSCADPKAEIHITNLPQTGWTIIQTGAEEEIYKGIGADTTLSLGAGDYDLNISNNAPACGYDFHLSIAGDGDCDGVFDDIDLDDDNDGILDTDEEPCKIASDSDTDSFDKPVQPEGSTNVGETFNGWHSEGSDIFVEHPAATHPAAHSGDQYIRSGGLTEHYVYKDLDIAPNLFRSGYVTISASAWAREHSTAKGDRNPVPRPQIQIVKVNSNTGAVIGVLAEGPALVVNADAWQQIYIKNVRLPMPPAGQHYRIRINTKTSIDLDTMEFCLSESDIDGDGIPNHLDTDSDGDGCPDAIEGNESVTADQLDDNDRIKIADQGGVDTDGVPNLVNDGGDQGQGVGYSNTQLVNACTDTDGDGYPDVDDLDDDNDGILDTEECGGVDPLADEDGDGVPAYLDDDDTKAWIGDDNSSIEPSFDIDGDGKPNHLDLDSDGDGCFDALEGSDNVQITDLITNGSINSAQDDDGVPILVNNGGSADVDGDQGQGLGTSQQAGNSACYIKTYNDINQTTEGESISGDLFVNDVIDDVNANTLVSAQCYDNNGNLINLPLDETETDVYVKDPDNPSSYIKAGTIKIDGHDGTYTFDPEIGFTGDVPFTYTAKNSVGATDTATLDIKVLPNPSSGNNPPIAQDDTYTVEQGDTGVEVPLLTNDSDVDGDALSVTEVKGLDVSGNPITLTTSDQDVYAEDPNNPGSYIKAGTAKMVGDKIEFSPAPNFTGDVPFDYTISDGNGGTDTATATITVVKDNTTGVEAANDIESTKKNTDVNGNMLSNDVVEGTLSSLNVNGTPITSAGTTVSVPGKGTFSINPDGSYTFTPDTDFVGEVSVPYTVCNADGKCDTATLTIYVDPTNVSGNNVVALNDAKVVGNDITAILNVLDNDDKSDASATLTVVAAELQCDYTTSSGGSSTTLTIGTTTDVYKGTTKVGTITVNSDGTTTFDPEPNFTGSVPVKYTTSDNGATDPAHTDTAVATITVLPSPDDIYANDDAKVGNKGETITVSNKDNGILGNDSVEDESKISKIRFRAENGNPTVDITSTSGAVTITRPGEGVLTINFDGTYTFVPEPDFSGTVEFPYEIISTDDTDSEHASLEAHATLYITILDRVDCGFLRSNRNVTRQLKN